MGPDVIPGAWQTVLLALFAFRLTRLVGWDDLSPVVAVRNKLMGAHWTFTPNTGRTVEEEVDQGWWEYRRPLLAHFVHCPFCLGAWISLLVAASWWLWPHATLLVALPFALSSAVGLIAKQLDP